MSEPCKSHLEVNDQTRLAQLGLKTKGVKLFSNDKRALRREKGKNKRNIVIRLHILQLSRAS